jgi:hypothetical protein
MAENTRLILRTEGNELFTKTNYKLSPTNIDPLIFNSMTVKDKSIANAKGLLVEIASFFLGSNRTNPTLESYSGLNGFIQRINSIRDIVSIQADIDIISGGSAILLEKIPFHKHANETEENIIRMISISEYGSKDEPSSKLSNLDFLRKNLYDPNYAVKMYKVGRKTSVTLNGSVHSGYLKTENCNPNMRMEIILRGTPVEMRRTETSANSNGTKNFIFTYPQYLINSADSIRSIQELIAYDSQGSQVFVGEDRSFPVIASDGSYKNLDIANKDIRNLGL